MTEEFSDLAGSSSGSSTEQQSINSSYADLFEASGVVIRDYGGSFSTGPLIANPVTYNLNKCKSNVIGPYYKLLCLISWRPFGKESSRGQCCLTLFNFLYTLLTFCVLLFWYVIRVYTCQGRLMLEITTPPPTMAPTTSTPFTIPPNTTQLNWTDMLPSKRIIELNATEVANLKAPLFLDPCQHVFGSYIVPNILHFLAFVIGFYHFRIQEHEGLYVLMEKVYLQSNYPDKITNSLKRYLVIGIIWLVFSLGTMIQYMVAFGCSYGTAISPNHPYVMYTMAAMIMLSGVFSNCVCLAVVLSYCGQCKLLQFYVDGVIERLEEKSTELKMAMKDVLDIKRHFNRLNGLLSLSMSCIVFDSIILVSITVILLFNFRQMDLIVWFYRATVAFQWGTMLIFVLIQASLLTARAKYLRQKALAIRVFGYQSHTQLDIDSFLNFLNMVELEAEMFTIPVKPRYLWGSLIFSSVVLILAFQTGRVVGESKWL